MQFSHASASRRQLRSSIGFGLILGLLAGGAAQAADGEGEGQLDIVAWAGYLERGDTDKNFDWVTGFEKETGCKVNAKFASSSDEMVSLMNEGGFDLVTASGDASLRLVAGGTVQAIDTSRIPSWNTIDERLATGAWHTVDGKHYGTPLTWGANVLMYDKTVFKEAPASWDVVFKDVKLPDGSSSKGRVLAYSGPIYIADAALYLKATQPALGITDPYALDETQYAAALEVLKGQRAVVARYWNDPNVQIEDFKREKIVASQAWPFQVNLLHGQDYPIASTVPKEGATGWADTTMMHAKAKHPMCAYKWMEHTLNRKVQGDLAAWYGSVPVVRAACDGNALLGETGCAVNGAASFEQVSFWRTPVAQCGEGRTCVPYSRWVSDYLAIQGGS